MCVFKKKKKIRRDQFYKNFYLFIIWTVELSSSFFCDNISIKKVYTLVLNINFEKKQQKIRKLVWTQKQKKKNSDIDNLYEVCRDLSKEIGLKTVTQLLQNV